MEKNKLRDFLKKVQTLSMELDEEERNEGATAALSAQTTEGSVGGTAVNENATGDNYENYDDLNSGADQEENPIYGTKSEIIVEGVEFPNVIDLPQGKECFFVNRRADDSYVLNGAILTKKYPLFAFIDYEKLLEINNFSADEIFSYKIELMLRRMANNAININYDLYSMKTGEIIKNNCNEFVIDIAEIYRKTGNASFVMITTDTSANFLPEYTDFKYGYECNLTQFFVNSLPNKTVYNEGQRFDTTGMRAQYNDCYGGSGTTETFWVEPSRALTTEDTAVTVGFRNRSIDIPITVNCYDGLSKPFDYRNLKEINICDYTTSLFDLNKGCMITSFESFNGEDMAIPLNITHCFGDKIKTSVFGNDWQLNLNKQLKVSQRDNDNNTIFTYTDEIGDDHTLNETYYYLSPEGKKLFIDKKWVSVDDNGYLWYGSSEVKRMQSCKGFTLVSKLDDFVNVEFVEQRQNEQAELEEYLNACEPTLKNYVKFNRKKGEIDSYRLLTIDKSAYKSLFTGVNAYSDVVIMTESQAEQLCEAFKVMDGDKKEEKLNAQEKLMIRQAILGLPALKDAFKNYLNKKARYETLMKHLPINYLKDDNGIINGFNGDGNLVCVFDKFGNSVTVEYDKKDRICALHDSNGIAINFKYNTTGKLNSICDNRGRMVEYEYSGALLRTVNFMDGRKITFKYAEPHALEEIETDRNLKTTFEYNSNLKIASITTFYYSLADDSPFSKLDITYTKHTTNIKSNDGTKEEYKFYSSGRLKKREVTDGAGFVTVNEYVYNEDADTKRISKTEKITGTAVKASYVTQVYDEFDKLISEDKDWQPISAKTITKHLKNYVYDDDDRLSEEITVTSFKTSTENGYENKEYETRVKYYYGANGNLVMTESWVVGEEKTCGKTIEERIYDENGNVIKTVKWNTLDSSTKFYTESDRAENGQITADRDETGEVSAEYGYLDGTNVINEVKYANGSKFAYGRDPFDFKTTAITQSTADGEANTTDIIYEHGLPVQVKSGNTVLDYMYDYKGNRTKVDVNGVMQHIQIINDGYSLSEDGNTAHFSTMDKCLFDYKTMFKTEKLGVKDEETGLFKTVENSYIDGELVLKNEYDIKNRLCRVIDGKDAKRYYYNANNALSGTSKFINGKRGINEDYSYNDFGILIDKKISTPTFVQQYKYGYKDNFARDLDFIKIGGYTFKPQRDLYGRNTGSEIFKADGKIAGEYISYRKVGDHATNMPCTVWYGSGTEIKESIKYTYDKIGNISRVTVNGDESVRYSYDSLNRFVREDNKKLNKTVKFSYDTNGNILSRCEYAYTLKNDEKLGELNCVHYDYSYDGDRLVNYDGESFAYNGMGSPTVYRGKALEWEYGNRLISFDGVTFAYDYRGHRLKKNNIEYRYDNDGRVIYQSNGLEFIYDNSGVTALKYGNVYYFYRKDAQGNIIALIDSTGNKVVQYIYDAWGNHSISGDEVLGNLNPFRYRSYYYDTETGLYYLQTRYYDPETGRFISQDSVEYADPESINGLNLYAYCGNNPVMYVDPTGTFLFSFLIAVLAGALIGGLVGGVSAVANGDNFWGGFLSGALVGGVLGGAMILGGATMLAVAGKAVSGFVVASTFAAKATLLATTVIGTATVSFVAGMGAYAIEESINGREVNTSEMIRQGINTGIKGLISFGTGMILATTGVYNYLLENIKWSFAEKIKMMVVRSTASFFLQFPWKLGLK